MFNCCLVVWCETAFAIRTTVKRVVQLDTKSYSKAWRPNHSTVFIWAWCQSMVHWHAKSGLGNQPQGSPKHQPTPKGHKARGGGWMAWPLGLAPGVIWAFPLISRFWKSSSSKFSARLCWGFWGGGISYNYLSENFDRCPLLAAPRINFCDQPVLGKLYFGSNTPTPCPTEYGNWAICNTARTLLVKFFGDQV